MMILFLAAQPLIFTAFLIQKMYGQVPTYPVTVPSGSVSRHGADYFEVVRLGICLFVFNFGLVLSPVVAGIEDHGQERFFSWRGSLNEQNGCVHITNPSFRYEASMYDSLQVRSPPLQAAAASPFRP
jgi:hypothetical protein